MYVSCRFHISFHIRHYVYYDHSVNFVIRMHFKVIDILDEALEVISCFHFLLVFM